jgi:hypothetical protein
MLMGAEVNIELKGVGTGDYFKNKQLVKMYSGMLVKLKRG